MRDVVAILDFGSQYTQLIARRIRELGVYSEIISCSRAPAEITKQLNLSAVILSGGPASVGTADAPKFDPAWLHLGVPTLGICYGMQLLAQELGGELTRGEAREYGLSTIEVSDDRDIFSGFSPHEHTTVWMSHGDHVARPPRGFVVTARSSSVEVAAMSDRSRNIYAIQFHPEVVHTPRGGEILSNFIFGVAKCKKNWDPGDFIANQIEIINQQVEAKAQVICGISGGVDSTVAAVLVHRAIGDRLTCIFVDNGLLRKDEGDRVEALLGRTGAGLKVIRVNASERFVDKLRGVLDPEEKRKRIGEVFIRVFEEQARALKGATHLVQGTLYPDVIESQSVRGPSATIKTHHNVGGLPADLSFKLIEPFRELFKDEVRAVGRLLGVPEDIVARHPFPGPGLAVRVVGEVTQERLELLREADQIVVDEVRAAGVYNSLWQVFGVLLPVRSVGVMGDGRTYEQSLAIRAVTSQDGMTADWSYLPHEALKRISNRVINEVRGINRVLLDISSKPPATIEWE